jgi:hypothetical protein
LCFNLCVDRSHHLCETTTKPGRQSVDHAHVEAGYRP